MAAADLESVIERVRAKSKRLREELSASRMEAAKAAEAAVKAAAASPGSSAVEPDKLKDVLKAVNLALEEKDEMEKAVQLQKAAMEATARAEAAEMMAQDNARRAQMAEEREEKIAGVFSKEADRALESLRYLSSLQETQRLETWTTETTVRRTGPGPFPPGFNPDAAAAAAAAQAAAAAAAAATADSSSDGLILVPWARVRIGGTSKRSTSSSTRRIRTTRKTFGAACDLRVIYAIDGVLTAPSRPVT